MASNSSQISFSNTSAATIAKQRVREELKKISETRVKPEDLQKLRQEIIPSSKTELLEQKKIVTARARQKESSIDIEFPSIDELQDTIKDLEEEVQRLLQESTKAQAELKKRREQLREGLLELLRLHKLIEQIDQEISEKTTEFQSKLFDLEQKRLNILNDPNLSPEEKQKLLSKIDHDLKALKETHLDVINLLSKEKEKLKDEARMEAKFLQDTKRDLEQDHLIEIRNLEKAKLNASPSEILKIEAKIREKQKQFNRNLKLLNDSASTKQYFFDENGRFYINEDGVKIYKRDSYASEYILGSNGKLTLIAEGVELFNDEIGEYYLDKFGKKIYTKMHLKDEYGEYFIDVDGNKIYLRDLLEQTSSFDFSENSSYLNEIDKVSSDEIRRRENLEYIKRTCGLALRQGLAKMILLKPSNPFNYLANFLIHYRCNQIQNEEKEKQIQSLLNLKNDCQNENDSQSETCEVDQNPSTLKNCP